MLTFLFLVLPLSLIFYYLFNKDSKFFGAMLVGVLCAVLLCAFKVFFTYSHRLIPDSFSENFVYYLLNESCLPLCGVSLIFFLIKKDSLENKTNLFFPLIAAFYAVYLPYLVISRTTSVYSGYAIFIKPVVYLAMIVQCALSLRCIFSSIKSKKIVFVAINLVLIVAYLIIPAIIETLYAMNVNFVAMIVLSAVFVIIPIVHKMLGALRGNAANAFVVCVELVSGSVCSFV